MMDKRLVRESFSRASATYDENAGFQGEVACSVAKLAGRLSGAEALKGAPALEAALGSAAAPVAPPAVLTAPGGRLRVLDVGCGTGGLAALLKEYLPGSVIAGCDIALPMLERARAKPACAGAGLAASDLEALAFRGSAFDVVASNLAYQWAGDPEGAFEEARRVLRPGGLFVFSTLGPRTFRELNAALEECGHRRPARSASFSGLEALKAGLAASGLAVLHSEARMVRRVYGSMWELLGRVRRIGAAGAGPGGAGTLRRAARVYAERFPAQEGRGVVATYELILMAARKSF